MRRILGSAAWMVLVGGVLLAEGCKNQSAGPSELAGRLLWSSDTALWSMQFPGRQVRAIHQVEAGSVITSAAWGPDGTSVYYAQFGRRAGETVSGSDIWIVGSDGGEARLLVERDAPGVLLESPSVASSGSVYYSHRVVQGSVESLEVFRRSPDGATTTVSSNAVVPSVAPDDSLLVYLRPTRLGQALVRKTLGPGGAECDLIPDSVFLSMSSPRVSPDGRTIAFAAGGQPSGRTGCEGGAPVSASAITHTDGWPTLLLGLFGKPAQAHGFPSDIWLVGSSGAGLRRVMRVQEDDPTVTWSPDGKVLAVLGTAALYVGGVEGGDPTRLIEGGGYGGIDWTR